MRALLGDDGTPPAARAAGALERLDQFLKVGVGRWRKGLAGRGSEVIREAPSSDCLKGRIVCRLWCSSRLVAAAPSHWEGAGNLFGFRV